ncbi:glycerophosphodiester phosphodiesterase [Candidatus Woesearchaeota archaeon]|nr:glycerophosphodiester phosphodiesterase [Candidatus Woesearchaeota archaeon]
MKPMIIGHRGSPLEAPENTVSSVKKAIKAGADGVEIDVQKTKDSSIVVIHDEKVDRTTGGKGFVKNLTLKEIKKLKIKSSDERIPLLQEIIDAAKGKAKLIVEIKEKGIENKVVEIIEKNNIVDDVYVISFYHKVAGNVKKINSKIKTGILFAGNPVDSAALARSANADLLSVHYKPVDREMVDNAHKSKLKIFVWNIDTTEDLKNMISLNVDGICSNKPGMVVRYLKRV